MYVWIIIVVLMMQIQTVQSGKFRCASALKVHFELTLGYKKNDLYIAQPLIGQSIRKGTRVYIHWRVTDQFIEGVHFRDEHRRLQRERGISILKGHSSAGQEDKCSEVE